MYPILKREQKKELRLYSTRFYRMKHQSDKMRASITYYALEKNQEEKKETDKELSDNSDDDN